MYNIAYNIATASECNERNHTGTEQPNQPGKGGGRRGATPRLTPRLLAVVVVVAVACRAKASREWTWGGHRRLGTRRGGLSIHPAVRPEFERGCALARTSSNAPVDMSSHAPELHPSYVSELFRVRAYTWP